MSFPLVLPHADIRRILERRATRLVRTARVKRGAYSVQDGYVVKRNERMRERGHLEELADPDVFAIEVTEVLQVALLDVDFYAARQCGYRTQRDFYDDWIGRRGQLDPYQTVFSVGFCLAEQPRFLHQRVFSGYTTNPALAARGEPEALGREDLERLAADGRARLERERREELRRRRARNLTVRYREAMRLGRFDEAHALSAEMGSLAELARA